jgi:hypothetical protein
VLNEALRHEDIWGSGGIAPPFKSAEWINKYDCVDCFKRTGGCVCIEGYERMDLYECVD